MAFIPVPNCAQFNLCYRQAGNELQNVFHLQNDSPFDAVSLALAADVFKTWWNTHYKNNTSNTLSLVKIIARALDSDSAPAIEYTTGLPISGNGAGTPLPANVTAAIKWTTAFSGRSYRGRTYHAGMMADQVSGNTLQNDDVTALSTMYNALPTAFGSTPYVLVVVSRFHANAPRTTGVATDIVGAFVDPNLDSQRRRLNGRGV